MLEDDDEFADVDDGDDDEDGNDAPTTVFVSVGAAGAASEESFGVISGVCDRLSLEALRAPTDPKQAIGTPAGNEAVKDLLDAADFAIIDLSHKRPTLAREISMAEAEFDAVFILLVAKTGTPLPAAIEDKTIIHYADKGDLRAVVEKHLNAMVDAWHETEEDEDEEEEDDGDDDE